MSEEQTLFEEAKNLLLELAEQAELPELQFKQSTICYERISNGNQSQRIIKSISCDTALPKDKKQNLDLFIKSYKNELEKKPQLEDILEIEPNVSLKVGDQFEPIKQLQKLTEEGEFDLVHNPGEVILIDFWATWCGPCQQPMAHNQKMVESFNSKFPGKVRIIGISIESKKETVKQKVDDKGWHGIEHYIFMRENFPDKRHPCESAYSFNGIPHIFLIDKKGKIVYVGHPASINLDQKIEQLVEENDQEIENDKKTQANEEEQIVSQEVYQKFVELYEKEIKELINNLFVKEKTDDAFISIHYQKNEIIQLDKEITLTYNKPNVIYYGGKKGYKKFQQITSLILSHFTKEDVQIQENVEDVIISLKKLEKAAKESFSKSELTDEVETSHRINYIYKNTKTEKSCDFLITLHETNNNEAQNKKFKSLFNDETSNVRNITVNWLQKDNFLVTGQEFVKDLGVTDLLTGEKKQLNLEGKNVLVEIANGKDVLRQLQNKARQETLQHIQNQQNIEEYILLLSHMPLHIRAEVREFVRLLNLPKISIYEFSESKYLPVLYSIFVDVQNNIIQSIADVYSITQINKYINKDTSNSGINQDQFKTLKTYLKKDWQDIMKQFIESHKTETEKYNTLHIELLAIKQQSLLKNEVTGTVYTNPYIIIQGSQTFIQEAHKFLDNNIYTILPKENFEIYSQINVIEFTRGTICHHTGQEIPNNTFQYYNPWLNRHISVDPILNEDNSQGSAGQKEYHNLILFKGVDDKKYTVSTNEIGSAKWILPHEVVKDTSGYCDYSGTSLSNGRHLSLTIGQVQSGYVDLSNIAIKQIIDTGSEENKEILNKIKERGEPEDQIYLRIALHTESYYYI